MYVAEIQHITKVTFSPPTSILDGLDRDHTKLTARLFFFFSQLVSCSDVPQLCSCDWLLTFKTSSKTETESDQLTVSAVAENADIKL